MKINKLLTKVILILISIILLSMCENAWMSKCFATETPPAVTYTGESNTYLKKAETEWCTWNYDTGFMKDTARYCSQSKQDNRWTYYKIIDLVRNKKNTAESYIMSYSENNISRTVIFDTSDTMVKIAGIGDYVNSESLCQWAWWGTDDGGNCQKDPITPDKDGTISKGGKTYSVDSNLVDDGNKNGALFYNCATNYATEITKVESPTLTWGGNYKINDDDVEIKGLTISCGKNSFFMADGERSGNGYDAGPILFYEISEMTANVKLANGNNKDITIWANADDVPENLTNFSIKMNQRDSDGNSILKINSLEVSIKYLECMASYDILNFANSEGTDGQNITICRKASREYKNKTITVPINLELYKTGKLIVEKTAYDGDGVTPLTSADAKEKFKNVNQIFTFKSEIVSGEVYTNPECTTRYEGENFSINATNSREITVYWRPWKDDPTIRVTEILEGDIAKNWEACSNTEQSATMKNNQTKTLTFENKVRTFEGSISIEKDVLNLLGENIDETTAVEGVTFKYNLTVKGYRKGIKKVDENTFTEEINSTTTKTETFYWYSYDETPTYKVEEIEVPEKWQLRKALCENLEGSLAKNETARVKIVNQAKAYIGYLRIKKEVVDTDGTTPLYNEDLLKKYGEEKTFKFDVTITNVLRNTKSSGAAYYNDTENNDEWYNYLKSPYAYYENGSNKELVIKGVEVKAASKGENGEIVGGYTEIGPFIWNSYETPEYTVTEDTSNEFEFIKFVEDDDKKLSKPKGILSTDNATITVCAKNKTKINDGGSFEIYKTFDLNAEYDTRVTFDYTVTNGCNVNDSGTAEFTIAKGKKVGHWNSKTWDWYGENVPTYSVKETKVEIWKDSDWVDVTEEYAATLINETGKISNNSNTPAIVYAHNEGGQTWKHNTIKIKKVLTQPANIDQTFEFTVKVEGYADETVTLNVQKYKTESAIVSTTTDYKWLASEEAPTYTITEKLTTDQKAMYQSVINPASGRLDDKSTEISVTATNVYHSGKLKITKDVSTAVKEDKTFKFKITISNLHKINGDADDDKVVYRDVTIPEGSKSGDSESIEVEWWDETKVVEDDMIPRYKVEELETEDSVDYNAVVTPSEGKFNENDEITVFAKNTSEKTLSNHIIINKESVNPVSETTTFRFEVTVSGHASEYVEVTIEKGKTKSSQGTSSTYEWKENEVAPTYSVTEKFFQIGDRWDDSAPTYDVDDYYDVTMDNATGSLSDKVAAITVTAENDDTQKRHEAYIYLVKNISDASDEREIFTFTAKIEGIVGEDGGKSTKDDTKTLIIEPGDTTSEKIKFGPYVWYGDEAPKYKVTENDSPSKYEVVYTNNEGTLVDGRTAEINVNCDNNLKKNTGSLKITKKLKEGQISDEEFTFRVTVNGAKNSKMTDSGTSHEFYVTLKAGETSDTYTYYWIGDTAPTYKVEEVNKDGSEKTSGVTLKNESGSLTSGATSTVDVTCVNDIGNSKTGNIKVTKDLISNMKVDAGYLKKEHASEGFGIKVVINGTFKYKGIEYIGSELVLNGNINYLEEPFEIKEITWYGDEAPTYYVEEISLPDGWKHVSTSYENMSTSQNSADKGIDLIAGTNTVKVTNCYEKNSSTKELGGIVWHDTLKYLKSETDKVPNGMHDSDEELMGNVEVYIYNSDGKLASLTNNGAAVSYPILTTSDGEWHVSNVPDGSYNVVFKYNGQDYTSTTLVKNNDNGSKAKEYENNSSNITEIYGGNAIDTNGDTTGYVKYFVGIVDGKERYEDRAISYNAEEVGEDYPVISKLVTENEFGLTYEIFKASASTNKAGYTVNAGDTHVNLGLKDNDTVDIELKKNLSKAEVKLKGKTDTYNFNADADLTTDGYSSYLKKNIDSTDYSTGEITLGLSNSGYYYRAEMYNTVNNNIYNKILKFKNSEILDEMEVELTYLITLCNTSKDTVKIYDIIDYSESSMQLKDSKSQSKNNIGNIVDDEINIAPKENWALTQTELSGHDNDKGCDVSYQVRTVSLNGTNGLELDSKEERYIEVKYRIIHKTSKEYISNSLTTLGYKTNVAEIGRYSSAKGIIDRDSAPNNVNMYSFNSKKWYEDDTYAAPGIELVLDDKDYDLDISGTVWEDERTDTISGNQKTGDGIKGTSEEVIAGMNTQLVEKIYVKISEETYTQYDFVLPTDDTNIPGLNGKSIKELCGFDSTVDTDDDGKYQYTNVPPGEYVVRFIYGNDANNKIESASYSTSDYYNGQDYKSGTYNPGGEGDKKYITTGATLKTSPTALSNMAYDSEVRRLEVIGLSRNLTNANTSIMSEYSDELFENYYMWADTARIVTSEVESVSEKKDGITTITNTLNKIGFCVEERPITALILDKQIEEIDLVTSDGQTIMKAVYSIEYTKPKSDDIDANRDYHVETTLITDKSFGTDNLQALNRNSATNQGFRYINMDEDILQGATITIKYRFTVINSGEEDRCGEALAGIDYDDIQGLKDACQELSEKFATYTADMKNENSVGTYIGSTYYYGKNSSIIGSDYIVSSEVRQLVDYVDSEMPFDASINSDTDTSWSKVTTSQLKYNGLISDEILKLRDGTKNLETDDDNNYIVQDKDESSSGYGDIIVSINSDSMNPSLVKKITPNGGSALTDTNMASINLTISTRLGTDTEDLDIDNLTEIIHYSNDVGRRDELTVAGNAKPIDIYKNAESIEGKKKNERDTSFTETITLSPPTGMPIWLWRLEVAIAIAFGCAILAGGVIIIKKKKLFR